MAYGVDVPLIIVSIVLLVLGAVLAMILLAKGGGAKKPRGKDTTGKKPSKKSSTDSGKRKSTPTPKTEKKAVTKTEKKTTTPKTEKKEVKKSDPKKADQATTSETPAAVPESPKVETAARKAETKTEKKKAAKKAAKAVAVEVPEETSAEDLEFARVMSSTSGKHATKGPSASGSSKKAEAETAEAKAAEQSASGARNWAEINAKNSEVQKYKAKLKESEKEIADLRRIIDDNKKKMREYNLTNAKLVSERSAQKETYEEKIARLKADLEGRRENRDVTVKSGDALRDRNYVVNVLQQERDTYKNQCTDLQLAYDDLRKEYQKLSEGDSDAAAKQQLEALSREHSKLVAALQEASQSEAALREQLQAERVNAAKLKALLESSASNSTGKEHTAGEDEDGKDEPIST